MENLRKSYYQIPIGKNAIQGLIFEKICQIKGELLFRLLLLLLHS